MRVRILTLADILPFKHSIVRVTGNNGYFMEGKPVRHAFVMASEREGSLDMISHTDTVPSLHLITQNTIKYGEVYVSDEIDVQWLLNTPNLVVEYYRDIDVKEETVRSVLRSIESLKPNKAMSLDTYEEYYLAMKRKMALLKLLPRSDETFKVIFSLSYKMDYLFE